MHTILHTTYHTTLHALRRLVSTRRPALPLAAVFALLLLSGCTSPDEHVRIATSESHSIEDIEAQHKSMNALVNSRDQARLAIVAKTAKDTEIRRSAVSWLTDQQVLADILKNEADIRTRRMIVVGLTDQQALAEVIGNSTDRFMRTVAAIKLTDQKILAELAKNDTYVSVRMVAAKNLTDQKILAEIAQSERHAEVRNCAVEKLDDQKVLAEIAKNDVDVNIRESAVKKLSEPQFLADVAKNASDENVRLLALSNLTDQTLLADVAENTNDSNILHTAVKRLTDLKILADLAERGKREDVRLATLWRLGDKALLGNIAKNDASLLVREAAAAKLSTLRENTSEEKTLEELINTGMVSASFMGGGTSRSGTGQLNVCIKRKKPSPLVVQIPARMYFICANKEAQNMVSTEAVRISLNDDNSQRIFIPVASTKKRKEIPAQDVSFTIGSLPSDSELARVMAVLNAKDIGYFAKQAAIWFVTANASLYELEPRDLDEADRGGNAPARNSLYKHPISKPDITKAIRLCAQAGINIKGKYIWDGIPYIFIQLPAGDLRDWLKAFGEITEPVRTKSMGRLLVSPDGKLLLSTDFEDAMILWSLPEGKKICALENSAASPNRFVFSPDGKWLIGHGNVLSKPAESVKHGLRVWSLPSGKLVRAIESAHNVYTFALSPNGELLAHSARGDGTIQLLRFPECEPLMELKDTGGKSVYALEFSPDGKWLFSAVRGDAALVARLWSLPDGKLHATLKGISADIECSISTAIFSPDGKWLTFSNGDPVRVWSLPTNGTPAITLKEQEEPLFFTPDSKQLFVRPVDDEKTKVFDLANGELSDEMDSGDRHFCLTPDGKYLLAHTYEYLTKIWDFPLEGAAPFLTRRGYGIPSSYAVITPNSKLMITSDSGTINLWSFPDGKHIKTIVND